jgi:hypothetical protein
VHSIKVNILLKLAVLISQYILYHELDDSGIIAVNEMECSTQTKTGDFQQDP